MLKPRKRLVRAKLKEDKFITQTARVQAFMTKHSSKLIYGLLAVAIVVVAGSVIGWSRAKAEKEAAFISLQVRDAYARGEFDESFTQANIILEDYPNSRYAAVAMMTKARILEQGGQISEAIETYEKLSTKFSDQIYLAFGAYYSLGSLYYGTEEYNDAARCFNQAATRYPKHFNAAYALLEAGRSYIKANKYDQAKKVLRKVLSEYPKSRAIDKVRQELEEIEFMP